MAAIYSGIYLKLKSPQTPWEDKLKLARFAWISSQCLLPNKEQVLLDWCTHALTGWYNKKVEFSQTVLDGLWCYLDDVIHSQKLHSLLKQSKTVSLRLNMAQLLLDRLQDRAGYGPAVCVSTVLSVCQGILSSSALSSVFTTKFELLVDLVNKLCSLACCELQQPLQTGSVQSTVQCETAVPCEHQMDAESLHLLPVGDSHQVDPVTENPPHHPLLESTNFSSKANENPPSAKLFEVLHQALACYLSVQRQQANPNRVFTVVTNQLFQPLILLRHLLTSGESQLPVPQQLCRDIRVKIDNVLQLALFPPELLNPYNDELLPSKEDAGKRSSGGSKGPLRPASAVISRLTAQSCCEPQLHYSVKSNTVSLLFKFFLESYGKGRGESEEEHRMLCFYFLSRLASVLDLGLDTRSLSLAKVDQPLSESACSPENWSLALLAVESLLNQALSADIYNVAADRIRHGEVQLRFYRALGQLLFNQAQPSIPAWYRCLKVMLSLNHLILEPDLDQLLSSAWVNADCIEGRVQKARQVMVCSLLRTYTKLRQLPRLFSELLSVICQPALDELRPPLLSDEVTASLQSCLLDTPPSQATEVCSLVLESIRKYILPDLVKDKMNIDDRENMFDGGKKDSSLKLFSLSQLLHTLLFNLKTLDNASPLPLVRQSQRLMEEMQQIVKELLQLFTEKKDEKIQIGSGPKTPKTGKKAPDSKDLQNDTETNNLWKQKTQEACLLLKYTWVEVDTLFHIHCSKYTSLDSALTSDPKAPVLVHIEGLLSGEISSVISSSPMSCLLFKLLTLQQIKKVLLDSTLLAEHSTAVLLTRAAQFILGKDKFELSVGVEQEWDGQVGSVNTSSYQVAHWYLVTSNLPLIVPYLSREDVESIAEVLLSSLLMRHTDGDQDQLSSRLTVSLISSQLLQSPILPELPSLFSAMVQCLTQRITGLLMAAHKNKACAAFQEKGANASQALLEKEALVKDILASSKNGEVSVLLSDSQTQEILNLLQILTSLNPDGMKTDDMSSLFLLLFFMFTSTSTQQNIAMDMDNGDGNPAGFLRKLLRILACLLEGRNFQTVLKLVHGGTLLQATVSSLLVHRFGSASSSDWLDLVKAVQGFIRSLVQLIIMRNSSVRLNLDQFASYLTSKDVTDRYAIAPSVTVVDISGKLDVRDSILSIHLLLASLTTFSQAMTNALGRNKPLDQTLTQMLTRTTATLGQAIESILKPQTDIQPTSILGQAFIVEVVTVMLQCELSLLSLEDENKQGHSLGHMGLYRSFSQQILKEISSAPRPTDFLVSSLRFLSAFYSAVERTRGDEETERKELDELYMQILQAVHHLLTAHWLGSHDLCELEPVVQELLHHLVEKSTTGQFNLLLLLIKDGLDIGKLRAEKYREVLSAVIIIKMLSCCPLPESCSKALWLSAPQIISAMMFLVRSSSQDISLTLPFTVPTVMAMTSLLRQGEGLISNPHHVTLVFGALQAVPLDRLTPTVYQSAFLAVHEALFAVIQCHPQVMLNAAPSFLNVFYRLVASIMQEGRQRKDNDTDGDVYQQCSRLIERMYSHIAATAESFTTLSAFMVAQYVTELQKVTLRSDIKLHLTEGIYRILDLCLEQDIKFLTAGLQMGVREVFNELYSSYTHYHKAQRQGEDKYTV
ncbi:unhealthy ribosome biogenesis protein 2 homolog [Sphaeramia orbicularis]|uniref:Nucleolar 27S pre-rRNA processing Urb2/Npa2 C-terminal domain-containing protein n=1 Tax=Sphaeramia orbicularis TaxID=375764 RepID=A0A673C2B8_9TELE|nr:unhealthy ribosome biogenesis protein 2 homolog [Sphaeramia orbicularis]